VTWLDVRFKRWTQPTEISQVASTLTELTRSISELIAENMFLRQQLIVLEIHQCQNVGNLLTAQKRTGIPLKKRLQWVFDQSL
jgi:hypothetical protein